jgi:hypothetical protein
VSPHSQIAEVMASCSSGSESEPELAHPVQGERDIEDLVVRVVTEGVERLVNSFRRDRRLPEKGPETGGGRNAKLAVAGRGEHDVIRTARSSNPDAAESVCCGTAPPGILLREQVVPSQRDPRGRRARAARASRVKIRPTTTRSAPSRTSASGLFQSPALIAALGLDGAAVLLIHVIATQYPCSGPLNRRRGPARPGWDAPR